jgi:amino acid adenylation domain-containing protein
VEFVGRRDFQVKIRGYRIELGEVETALAVHPEVREAVVLCRENALGDKRLVGYVVLEPGADIGVEVLRDRLGESLPPYMVPSAIMVLPSMPISLVGKIDRAALPEPGGGGLDSDGFVAPSGTIETQIAAIWTELLGVERVGAQDSFFDLGGHSLLATRLVSRIRDSLGVELSLRTVFTMPTVSSMAQQLREASDESTTLAVVAAPISRRQHSGTARLSFAQSRMWFLSHLDMAAEAYTVLMPLRLRGMLDMSRLEWAFSNLVSRHEVLRTTFALHDGEVVQVIHPAAPFEVAVQAMPDGEACDDARIAEWLSGIRALGFDLERGPLLRASLLRCAADDHVLAVSMHHIVTDGWSMDILMRELGALYGGGHEGGGVLLPLPIQYADFAEWQMDLVGGELLAPQIGYWREQLAHLTALDLPSDRPRTASQTFAGARRQVRLDAGLVHRLEQLGRDEGATLFMTMLAAFALMLHRYTGQDDIVVGSPIANRNRAEVEQLIGFFVNTLVMRIDVGGSPTFRELLARSRDVALASYANQDVPFEMLVDELAPVRDVSRNPLFQVLFLLQRAATSTPSIGDLEMSPIASRVESTRFDLECHVWHRDDGVDVNLVYNVQLFDDKTIERMLEHYHRLLEGSVADPDRPIGEFDMLGDQERRHLLVELNDNTREYPRDQSVHALFEAQAARTPNAVAAGFQEQTLTYAELDARTNQLARALQARACRPGDLIGICMDRSLDLIIAMLGVLKAGCAYVPLDPSFPAKRLSFMMEDCGARVLLTHGRVSAPSPGPGCSVIDVDAQASELLALDSSRPAVASDPDDLAYVIYTSGSTGQPKGICIQHRALVNFLYSMAEQPGIAADDVLLSVTTPSFDIFGLEAYLPLLNGARVQIAAHETTVDLGALAHALDEHAITLMQATPATWKLLIASGWSGRRKLKALCGGEVMSPQLAEQLRQRTASVWNMYGPTETTIWSTVEQVVGDTGAGAVSIGRPIANTPIYILDGAMQPVPAGVAGELCIGGDGVARGYHCRAELTAEKFVPDPFSDEPQARMYRTGDQARYLSDGRLQYLGRIDQQVKLRGFRIELGEIEATLVAHPGVRESVVICREDEPGDARLVAYVVGSRDADVSPRELREQVAARLPVFMMPGAFVVLDAIPLTPNGKIDRLRLPAPDGVRHLEDAYVAPRTRLETRLSQLWSEVLRVDRVGIHDNFFDLGGNSLLILKLRTRIADETGVAMPVVELFTHPSVHQIAAHLDGQGMGEVDREAAVQRARKRRASSARRRPVVSHPATELVAHADENQNGQ